MANFIVTTSGVVGLNFYAKLPAEAVGGGYSNIAILRCGLAAIVVAVGAC